MDFPRPSVSPSNIIGDLKDRFGFGGGKQQRNYGEDAYYDDYNDYGYDEGNPYDSEESYGSQADPYDRLEYTTRSTSGRSSRSSRYASSPHLVSSDDIRATTSAYGVSAGATSSTGASYTSGSAYSDSSIVFPSSQAEAGETEHYDVPATTYTDFVSPYKDHSRSAGLDSLFTPSSSQGSSDAEVQGAALGDAVSAGVATSSSREITLLQPTSYDDVASVARSLKLGNIVVLSLRSTDSSLAKRVLDFSFGVASALDAKVDCVASKTFVIVQGSDLSLEEHHRLQKQGILQVK